MLLKLGEQTNGNHVYMKMRLDNGRIEEIDVYFREDGITYITSADHGMSLNPEEHMRTREMIIAAFNKLY